jgi:uncharacterized protein (DUF697 family)
MAKAGLITGILGLLGSAVAAAIGIWISTMTPERMEEMFNKFEVPEQQRQEFREKLEAERAKQQP